MAAYIEMPKLSDTMSEGTLLKWLIKEGDTVAMGDEVAEVQTDKAVMAMTSFEDGVIHKIYVQEGDEVPLNTPLALVLEAGEDPPADADTPPVAPEAAADESKPGSEDPAESAPAPAAKQEKPNKTTKTTSVSTPVTASGSRVKASPLAKKLAKERGIDLAQVRGSGPGGRVVKDDLDFLQGSGGGGSSLGLTSNSLRDETIALSGMRRVIADRLLESKTTIPHFYLNIEIDAAPLMKLRAEINEASLANEGPKYTVNDYIMRAVALACQAVPAVNASFQGDTIQEFGEVNLAVAVAIDEGLVTPVIRGANSKSIKDLSAEIRELAGKAREMRLTPDEMQGGTITISNLGAYGIVNFDAIINPPQAAILSIGTVSKVPVVDDNDQIVAGQRMWIGMSCDHRVIDGAVGATYLKELKRLLESPVLLVA